MSVRGVSPKTPIFCFDVVALVFIVFLKAFLLGFIGIVG